VSPGPTLTEHHVRVCVFRMAPCVVRTSIFCAQCLLVATNTLELGGSECTSADAPVAESPVLLQTTFEVSGVIKSAEPGPRVNISYQSNVTASAPVSWLSRDSSRLRMSQSAADFMFASARLARPAPTFQVAVIVLTCIFALIGLIIAVAGVSPTRREERSVYRLMAPAYLLVFVGFLGVGMAEPLLPVLVLQMGGSQSHVGYLTGCNTAGCMLGSVVAGALSEYIGRKPVMLSSLIGLAFAYTWVALAPNMLHLYLSRFVAGFLAGSPSLSIAMIADLVGDEDTRYQYIPMTTAMIGLGWTIGPAIAGVASAYAGSEQLAMLMCPVICLFVLVLSVFILEETREEGNIFGPCSPEVERIRSVLRNQNKSDDTLDHKIPTSVWVLAFATLVLYAGVFMLDASGSVVWMVLFNWDTAELAKYWTLVGFIAVITSLFLSPWLLRLLCARNSFKLAALLGFVGIGCFSLVHSFIPHMALVILTGLSMALGETCAAELICELAPTHLRGHCVGIIDGAYFLGCVLGSFVAGASIQSQLFVQRVGGSSYSSLGFIVGGGFSFLAFLTICRFSPEIEAETPGAESLLPKGLLSKDLSNCGQVLLPAVVHRHQHAHGPLLVVQRQDPCPGGEKDALDGAVQGD